MITARTIAMRLTTAAALLIPALLAAPASAQTAADLDPRWQPWLGCWQPANAPSSMAGAPERPPVLCVVPVAGAAGVQLATVVDGQIVERERLEATGERRPSQEESCTGWESVEWSQDGVRLYRRSEHDCGGRVQRGSSAVMAMLPSGEWLHVQGVTAGGNDAGVRVLRYRPATQTEELPAEVSQALQGRGFAVDAARLAAASPLTVEDVVEATQRLNEAVVEALLIERQQGFSVDARKLVALADAGVPERVIDVMVALSYPDVFAINRASGEGEFRRTEQDDRAPRRPLGPVSVWDPWYYPGYGYGSGYGYGYGYGYPGYGYSNYGYYNRPVVIVPRDSGDGDEARPAGRAVKGRGYTRGGGNGSIGSTSTSRPSSSAGSSRAGSSSGSSGSGSSSGSTRTAKPRGGGE